MNNTKWREIFREFYYGLECSEDPALAAMMIVWTTKTLAGFVYTDATWSHFGASEDYKEIEWLRIELTNENKDIVLDILRRIHVPGEVLDDAVYIYGYRTDVDYIS